MNSEDEALEKIERLVAELRAIERFDERHWKEGCPKLTEMLAFESRQDRRRAILSELTALLPNLEHPSPKKKRSTKPATVNS
jgi:hypothetical protein